MSEIEELKAVVGALQRAQQTEDVEGFVALFHPDATWVTGGGRRLVGRDEIAAFTARVLPGAMKESTQIYEVVHVVAVRPDVAIVATEQRYVTHDGKPIEGAPEGRPTYVMAKDESGSWQIVAGQNTQVASD